MKNKTIAIIGITGSVLFILTALIGGMLIPNYNPMSQLISESYAIDTEFGLLLRYLGYLPSGICFTIFSIGAIYKLPKSSLTKLGFMGIAFGYGITTILVSFFPCDKGCNLDFINPSFSQDIHNLSGIVTYMIVPPSIIVIGLRSFKCPNGKKFGILSLLIGIIVFCFLNLFLRDFKSPLIGFYQRAIEGSFLVWTICCSLYVYNLKSKLLKV